ncbi:hypothetical protein BKA69DRAFT_606289 [Paraphysoderma sedebokerense]|nr:hypothetical protein BKA69DRAFT_606289 [Paraphysoderma sedebokerense]
MKLAACYHQYNLFHCYLLRIAEITQDFADICRNSEDGIANYPTVICMWKMSEKCFVLLIILYVVTSRTR